MTLIEVVAVIFCIVVLVGMLLPASRNRRRRAKTGRITCISNLKQIGLAYQIFASDNDDKFPWQVTNSLAFRNERLAWLPYQAMSNELQSSKVLCCPEDKSRVGFIASDFNLGKSMNERSLARLGNNAVSYFTAVDVTRSLPQAILAGDRNLAPSETAPAYSSRGGVVKIPVSSVWSTHESNRLHDNQGNILFADGSAQLVSASSVQQQLVLAAKTYGTNVNRFLFPQ